MDDNHFDVDAGYDPPIEVEEPTVEDPSSEDAEDDPSEDAEDGDPSEDPDLAAEPPILSDRENLYLDFSVLDPDFKLDDGDPNRWYTRYHGLPLE